MIGKKQEPQPQQEQPQLSKEEYAAMKQAEREEVWSRVNAQADSVFKDDESMKGFLNFMANCTPQSTRNLLILYEQNPEITHPRTFDKWKEAGRSIRSGEKGYTFFAEQEYKKTAARRTAILLPKPMTSPKPEDPSLCPRRSICLSLIHI